MDSKSKNYQYTEWAKMQIKRCYQFVSVRSVHNSYLILKFMLVTG